MKSFSRWKTFNFCDAPSLSVASVSRREEVKVNKLCVLLWSRPGKLAENGIPFFCMEGV